MKLWTKTDVDRNINYLIVQTEKSTNTSSP